MTATIIGPKSLTVPAALGGDDQIYGLVLIAVTRGLFVQEIGNGQVKLAGLKDFDLVTPDIVSLLVAKGAEVLGYPTFFGVTKTDVVPEGIPGADGVITWDEWKAPNHEWITIEGVDYLEAVYGEEYVPASSWVPLRASESLIVLSRPEYVAIQTA